MYKVIFKRLTDLLVAFFALVILSPVFIIILVLLSSVNQGKPFFFQRRPGRNEEIFSIIKFKTMTDEKDAHGNLLPEARRTTKIGEFMRRTSLDEIPQLINVLKGDMSLIGPRPLRVHYLPYYTNAERIRHSVRPGITGLAQVSGRNSLSWDDKLALDITYVKNLSLLLDLKIILKTIKRVLSSEHTVYDPNMLDLDELRKSLPASESAGPA
ncbi:MAG TPA: sugar transferase [Sphingobacteriaceae bacterium]